MTGKRRIQGGMIEVEGVTALLVLSDRRSLSLEVERDLSLVLRAPRGYPEASIRDFLASRVRWVEKHRARLSALRAAAPSALWEDGGSVPFLGGSLTLRVRSGSRSMARIEGATIIATARDISDAGELRRAVERLLSREAAARFPAFLDDCLSRAKDRGIPRPGLRLRAMRARWGSCDTRAKIVTLNTRLLGFRPEAIDYVVMHELAHLRYRGHGKRFYALLAELCPDWRELRAELAGAIQD